MTISPFSARSTTPARRLAITALLVVGAFGLGACGGSDGDGGSDATSAPVTADLVVKAIDGIKWDADTYTASAGAVEIAVENESSLPHDLYIVAEDGTALSTEFDIPSRGDIETESVDLAAGTYTLICKIPGHANMKSVLTVS